MAIITKQTAAATSDPFSINVQRPVTQAAFNEGNYPTGTTFKITGGVLGTDEYVQLKYMDGETARVANIEGNTGKILDEDNALCTIYGRMTDIVVYKSVTASAIGVEVM